MKLKTLLAGAALALAARALFPKLLLAKFSGDVAKLNAGDHTSLLDAYADDFVLHFAEGPHRWSGDWSCRVAPAERCRVFSCKCAHPPHVNSLGQAADRSSQPCQMVLTRHDAAT